MLDPRPLIQKKFEHYLRDYLRRDLKSYWTYLVNPVDGSVFLRINYRERNKEFTVIDEYTLFCEDHVIWKQVNLVLENILYWIKRVDAGRDVDALH